MARRKTKNKTGIKRIEGIHVHDAWVTYTCLKCNTLNYIRIGQELLTSKEAVNSCTWKCKKCGFIHSSETDLLFENWKDDLKDAESPTVYRFWDGFFKIAVEKPESYWKQCNVCGRILPFSAFSKHTGWGPLEKQMECRSCKGAINAILNPKRSKEQLHESAVRRRIADLFVEDENEKIDFQYLFKRFDSKCFKTKKQLNINDRKSWEVDHILPSKYLYPLKEENAALLCKEANSNKRDKWPSKFYTNNELIELAKITGANLNIISQKLPIINKNIDVNKGVDRYLQVREQSDLEKRISEIRKILQVYDLVNKLSRKNKKLLGF
jgi:transcription elongation factor Elf1/5-methylcytosine-specific restriction endonuclease McrA